MKTTTPMTPDLFYEWKKKKIEERDANLAAQQAERAKNDRMRYIHYPLPIFICECMYMAPTFFYSIINRMCMLL